MKEILKSVGVCKSTNPKKHSAIIKAVKQHDAKVINDFVERVEREAEKNMMKTGKLEGAHYAAMIKLRDEHERNIHIPTT